MVVSGSPALLIRATKYGSLAAGRVDASEKALAEAENMVMVKRNRIQFIGGVTGVVRSFFSRFSIK